jgi:Uma2 family endonuclease
MVASTTSRPRLQFTRARFDAMVAAGILTKDDRVELLDGEVYQKMPKGPKHTARIKALIARLTALLGPRVLIGCQDPVALNEFSEPEPDISVLQPREDFYESGHPEPKDVILLVEVSDSTLDYDRDLKIPLYAACDIPEVWLVDVKDRSVTVHQQPEGNCYRQTQSYRAGDVIPLRAFPGESISVSDLGI